MTDRRDPEGAPQLVTTSGVAARKPLVMRETIQRVMAAEDEARRLVEDARIEGEAHLDDCRRRAQELAERAQREGRREGEEILRAASEEALRQRERLIHSASAEIETMIRLDEPVACQSVNAIVRCVCGQGKS